MHLKCHIIFYIYNLGAGRKLNTINRRQHSYCIPKAKGDISVEYEQLQLKKEHTHSFFF